ncbi:DUF2845 domain-containing protein [uncultured Desulfobacter sp.]|uniref:DUF2845 domain-containing protein n=1 Tax=uncultured Desulfobacter sp. TaxID=240139 RepID=UPI0029F5A1EF|nr:DUF2845 domain-containing protein [uncultured Desulfobacter sp.]
MKQIITLTAILTFLFGSAVNTYAFRCGEGKRNLASEGQHKYQILKDCGPPVSKEIVGVDEKGNTYRIVEEWLYIFCESFVKTG